MQLYKYNDSTLRFEYHKRKNNLWMFILFGTFLICLGFGSAVKVNTIMEKIPIVLSESVDECNDVNVKAYIAKLHIKFPDIVYRQVILESGHYSSPLFKGMNNLVGMQPSLNRPTTGQTTGQRFASYDHWKESLIDYALWQASYTRDIQTEEQYYQFLDKIYCEHDSTGVKYSTNLKNLQF